MAHIRDMQGGDAEQVSQIYRDSWTRTYSGAFSASGLEIELQKRFSEEKQTAEAENPDVIALVAIENDAIIGASSSSMDERNQAWIDRMHVLPSHQGKGIADDLLTATLVKHSGLQSIALKVLQENDRAIAFYEKHGFSETELIENDPKVGGVNCIIMSRTLPRS